jgi:hypothetical protein
VNRYRVSCLLDLDTELPKASNRRSTVFPIRKVSINESPLAIAAIIAARCDIDLSPGRLMLPHIESAGFINIISILALTAVHCLDSKPFETLTFTSDPLCLK